MAGGSIQRWKRHPALLGALLVVLASQISISLLTADFKISVAVVLLPVLTFLWPEFPVLPTALLAAPGVFVLRTAVQWVSEGTAAGCWRAHGPEMLFYLVYGLLFARFGRGAGRRPIRAANFLPLILIDAAANFCELLLRMGTGVFAPGILLQLAAVGLGRTLLAWGAIRVLDYYGFQVLRREDSERYQRLLLITAALKSEVAWMDKGTALIEQTMNAAYHLYSQLRGSGADPEVTGTALTIAKDIHEVKKEYFLIMRGISEALDSDQARDGMELRELFHILERSTLRSAREAGKKVVFTGKCADSIVTGQHHYLMSIFRNLLNNAVEAAGTGSTAHISLTGQREGDWFVFRVEDDCGGIPASRIEKIFTPGFSSKINYETGEINRGLGLTIVKGLTEEKLGGSVEVDSQAGGTVFTVRIPARELEGTQDAVLSDR